MGYKGQIVTIPLGGLGLLTDETQGRIPAGALIRAQNVTFQKGIVEKDFGSLRWNTIVLPAGVSGAYDWWPDEARQRLIAICKDGKVYRFVDREAFAEVTATGTAPATLNVGMQPVLTAGGAESAGRNRKLFILTGTNQVQMISGDGTTRANIATPAADWSTSFPTFALVHNNRLCALGNQTDPHRLYLSSPTDHENFTGAGATTFSIFPGEGERLISAATYKGRLFLFKFPAGVYYLSDEDPNPANWTVVKLSTSFGIASPASAITVLDDFFLKNSTGSITSLQATQKFGDIESGDVLRLLRNEAFMRQTTSRNGTANSHALYYEDKKLALFTYQSAGGTRNDRIMTIDFNLDQNPRISWNDKDQPNFLVLQKDSLGVPRPIYGADDGYIYLMDRETREINGAGYRGEFQTSHVDLGFSDPTLAERMKLFDFLEVAFEETGNWDLSVDVFLDNVFAETIPVRLTKEDFLNSFPLQTADVMDRRPQSFLVPLHGTGRRISFKCYNSGLRQNFRITALSVYFRLAGQLQKG